MAVLAFGRNSDHALVIYNHSPSIPVGFYLRSHEPVERGAIVTVRATDASPEEAKSRRFDGPRDYFIKRVAALDGDRICAHGDAVDVNGHLGAVRRQRDSAGEVLAHWNGCRTLESDEAFLLGDSADSYDARYWGPIETARIAGVWSPLFHR